MTPSSVASVQVWTLFPSSSPGPFILYSAFPAVSLLVSVSPEPKVPIWCHEGWRVVEISPSFVLSPSFPKHTLIFFISPMLALPAYPSLVFSSERCPPQWQWCTVILLNRSILGLSELEQFLLHSTVGAEDVRAPRRRPLHLGSLCPFLKERTVPAEASLL